MGNMIDLLDEIAERVDKIPPIKSAPKNIVIALSDDNYSIDELAGIVEADISLTARCLRTVNSAAFGLRSKVDTISHALNLLGSKNILHIILKEAFDDIFTAFMKGYDAEPEDFWNYSLRTAISSKIIAAQFAPRIQSSLAYTAGLLHDIGKIVICEFLEKAQPDFSELLFFGESQDFLDLEESVFGTNHALVGEKMSEKWQFPESLRSAVRYHHEPAHAPPEYQELVAVVHVGFITASLTGVGTGVDSLAYRIDPYVENLLRFDRKNLAKLICDIDVEYLDIIHRLDNAKDERQ